MKMSIQVNEDITTVTKDEEFIEFNTKDLTNVLYDLRKKIDVEKFKKENEHFTKNGKDAIIHLLNLTVQDLMNNQYFNLNLKETKWIKNYLDKTILEFFLDYCNNSYYVLKIIYKYFKEVRGLETNDVINIISDTFGIIYPHYYLYDYNSLFIDVFERDYNEMIEKLIGDYYKINNKIRKDLIN